MNSRQSLANQLEMSRNVHDIGGLDKLRQAAKSGDKNALREAAGQFEAIFVQMMLKSMRKAQDALADENSPFNSHQVKFYRDMHDQQLATDLASTGAIGLADVIVQQLGQSESVIPASVIRNDGNLSVLNRPRIKSVQKAQDVVLGKPGKKSAFDTPDDFVQTLLPKIKQFAAQLNLDPKAMLAQAAIETGWGQHMIHNAKGQNSHNLFGIKAHKGWHGDKAPVNTLEYTNGVAKSEKANFRAYGSFEQSMQDYVSFIQQNPRYRQAIQNTQHPEAYFRALQEAGYATDPDYADKVLSVLSSKAFATVK